MFIEPKKLLLLKRIVTKEEKETDNEYFQKIEAYFTATSPLSLETDRDTPMYSTLSVCLDET